MLALNTASGTAASVPVAFDFKPGDVIALIGGANVVGEQDHGYLEVLLRATMSDRKLRVRNLGWEGDTVYEQPRELNFGSWTEQFKKAGATVIISQFGQMESLQGRSHLPQFVAAYRNLLEDFSRHSIRIVLVSPIPFERGAPPLPDLSRHNRVVEDYAEAIRQLAQKHGYRFIDLFNPLRRLNSPPTLTSDGIHLNQTGHWTIAIETLRQLDAGRLATLIHFNPSTGGLSPIAAEQLRQSVLAKNRLWFDYWRPMNWAFLAGDRTGQPSSRDHRDPSHRWFPIEMEQYPPLIEAKEREIAARTAALSREVK